MEKQVTGRLAGEPKVREFTPLLSFPAARRPPRGARASGRPTEAARAGRAAAIIAATSVRGRIVGRRRVRETRFFLSERQQRIALGAAHAPTRVFAQEEDDEGENKTEADDDGKWDDGHGKSGISFCRLENWEGRFRRRADGSGCRGRGGGRAVLSLPASGRDRALRGARFQSRANRPRVEFPLPWGPAEMEFFFSCGS